MCRELVCESLDFWRSNDKLGFYSSLNGLMVGYMD